MTENQNDPPPEPCPCDEIPVVEVVLQHQTDNDNNAMPPYPWSGPNNLSPQPTYDPGPYSLKLQNEDYIILPPGDYYFDSIELSGTSKIVLGYDNVGDGVGDGVVDTPLGDDETVTFYVSGPIYLGDDASITGDGTNPPYPANFEIISSAVGPLDIIKISGQFEFYGFIHAPFTTVDIHNDVVFYGGSLSDVFLGQDKVFFHFEDDGSGDSNLSGGAKMISWNKD